MADLYKLTADVFTLPYHGEESILYAPRAGFACVVNEDVINLLANLQEGGGNPPNEEESAVLEYLAGKGILNGSQEINCVFPYQQKYQPPQLTLFPTNQCNLRCTYCYASAGERIPLTMEWRYAQGAIEFMLNGLKERKSRHLAIGFHGGGEPLYPWAFVKRVVRYVEERCKEENFSHSIFSATNGVLSEKQLQWIIRHFVNLNISFDGLAEVQDRQRPLANGRGSFQYVDRTMHFLDQHRFNYGIRGTISNLNIDRMVDSVHFIGRNYQCKSVHLEPLFYCGRCKTTTAADPNMEAFAENFARCEDVANEYGIQLLYSGCHLDMLRNTFCGAANGNFSITPDGCITSCYEVTDASNPRSDRFFFGRIGADGQVIIDEEKRRRLFSLTVDQLEYCADCFAKWHCAGECAAKIPHDDLTGARGHDRCQLNRRLIANRLHRMVEGKFASKHLSCQRVETVKMPSTG